MQKTITILLLLLTFATTKAQDSQSAQPVASKTSAEQEIGFVVYNQDTIFTINTALGPYSAHDRAEIATNRLKLLDKNSRIQLDSLKVLVQGNNAIILYQMSPLTSVNDEDGAAVNKTRDELAQEQLEAIKTAFKNRYKNKSLWYWLLHLLYTLIAIAGLVVIFKLVNRLFRWLSKYVAHYQQQIKKKRKSFWRYLAPNGPDSFFAFVLKLSKILLLVFILLLYLPIMFSFLPWTENLVRDFYAFVKVPVIKILLDLWEFISEKLIYIVLIFYISKYLLRVISFVASELESGKLKINGFHQDWSKPTYNIVRVLVIAFTLVFMWPFIPGSQSDAFKGVSIFLGILFSLGSTSAIANVVAGIVITYMRPFQIGDRVKIGETIGDIVEKNLLVTRIRTIKNEDVTIPNATIINTHLWNYTKNASQLGIILHTSITIGYDVPSKTVTDLLIKAANNTPNLTRDFKPFVLQKSLNDFYVEYELNVYTKQPNKMAAFYSDIHDSILREFNEAGVEIMSPHYTAYRDGNKSTIPGSEIPDPPKDPVTKVVEKITGKLKTKKSQ